MIDLDTACISVFLRVTTSFITLIERNFFSGQLSLPLSRLSRETVYNYIVEHCGRYKLNTVEMNSKDDEKEHVLVSESSQDKYDVSFVAKLNLDAEEGQLGLKFYVVKTHRRELFPKMKAEVPRRKQSSGFAGDSGTSIPNPNRFFEVVNLSTS